MRLGRSSRLPIAQLVQSSGPWVLLLVGLLAIRLSKGAPFLDAYALLSRPFWPGSAQSDWLRQAQQLDQQARLVALEADNRRLRRLLDLRGATPENSLTAVVISRETGGWWQQLTLGIGSLQGLAPGDPVLAPGGLIGRITAVTPSTARVTLLTDSSSRLGVWVGRTQRHGLLMGTGSGRVLLRFIDRDPGVRPGDVVTTSPASTLLPPNLTVGVIQSVAEQAMPAPEAVVQLSAPVDAVDWVQVRRRESAP